MVRFVEASQGCNSCCFWVHLNDDETLLCTSSRPHKNGRANRSGTRMRTRRTTEEDNQRPLSSRAVASDEVLAFTTGSRWESSEWAPADMICGVVADLSGVTCRMEKSKIIQLCFKYCWGHTCGCFYGEKSRKGKKEIKLASTEVRRSEVLTLNSCKILPLWIKTNAIDGDHRLFKLFLTQVKNFWLFRWNRLSRAIHRSSIKAFKFTNSQTNYLLNYLWKILDLVVKMDFKRTLSRCRFFPCPVWALQFTAHSTCTSLQWHAAMKFLHVSDTFKQALLASARNFGCMNIP